jgi:Protein of unknown function (DUF3137)
MNIPDVDALMAAGLRERLDSLFAERAKTRAKVLRTEAYGMVAGAIVGGILWLIGVSPAYAFAGGALVAGAAFTRARNIKQTIVNSMKQEMNGALATALGIDYSVAALPGQEFERACEFQLLPKYDDSYFQDQWTGQIDDTNFLLLEAILTKTDSARKNNSIVTVFQGVILRFQFTRSFLAATLVRREGFKFSLLGDTKSYGGKTLERIKMVDPQFEAVFDIYGTDQVESRYLVHPVYCELLLELEREFKGANLAALFYEGDMIVTVQTGDIFESATLDPEDDREQLKLTIEQFATITRLVKVLNEQMRS